ncbi:MAG: PEGA domain-containing protein [Polyangiaceae bacterium]
MAGSVGLARGAEATPADCKKLADLAEASFRASKYGEAIVLYQQAYECGGDAGLYFSMGQAQLQTQEYAEAWQSFAFVEAHVNEVPDYVQKAIADGRKQIRPRVGLLTLTSTRSGAEASIGDEKVGPLPLSDFAVKPGKVHVEVTSTDGSRRRREVDVHAGETYELQFEFPDETAPIVAPTPPAATSTGVSPLIPIGFSIAGVGLLVGSICGGVSIAKTNDILPNCPNGQCSRGWEQSISQANAIANASNAFFVIAGIGGVLGGVGIGLTVSAAHTDPTSPAISVGPGGIRLTARFQ